MTQHLFCFNLVGLSPALLDKLLTMPACSTLATNGRRADMTPAFPCLTLPGQASFSTGTPVSRHGIVANGFYYRDRFEISFWDQYRSLVEAPPFWEILKAKQSGIKTATLFCQNTLHGKADIIITPKPMHTDEGLVQWCYSKPAGKYESVCQALGRPFNLMDYWGPFASSKASEWIMDAAVEVLKKDQPDVMITYLPHLDYSCQKFGPDHPAVEADLSVLDQLMGRFLDTLETQKIMDTTTICLFSEYSISKVSSAVSLNTVLREHGLLNVRTIEGREYLDLELSPAFAMADHQIAHIYLKPETDADAVKELIQGTAGVDQVMDVEAQKAMDVYHNRSGELLAVSNPDKWFSYYWWQNPEKAPDFAGNIDIHRKPGYDPLELFMDKKTMKIPQTPELIKGSHGAPAKGERGMAVFMLCGNSVDKIHLPEKIEMIDAVPILMAAMGENNV